MRMCRVSFASPSARQFGGRTAMSRLPGARSLLLALLPLTAGSGLTLPAQAQPGAMRGGPPSAPPPREPVQLPQSVPARQKLAAVHDYSKARSWPEAVRLLQALLDAPADSFRRMSYRDKQGK